MHVAAPRHDGKKIMSVQASKRKIRVEVCCLHSLTMLAKLAVKQWIRYVTTTKLPCGVNRGCKQTTVLGDCSLREVTWVFLYLLSCQTGLLATDFTLQILASTNVVCAQIRRGKTKAKRNGNPPDSFSSTPQSGPAPEKSV